MAKGEEKQRSTTATKKMKDKWRAKAWYHIYAPEMFQSVLLGETLADEPQKLKGRVCEATVHDLTGDFSRMHIKLRFSISDVQGTNARTQFIGHELTSDYVRRLTRRKRSKIDASFAITTKDNYTIQIKPMAVAEKRIQSAQQTQIRSQMFSSLQANASEMTLNQFVSNLISGDLAKGLMSSVKSVYPIKKIEIRKTEVSKPTGDAVCTPKDVDAADTDDAGTESAETPSGIDASHDEANEETEENAESKGTPAPERNAEYS